MGPRFRHFTSFLLTFVLTFLTSLLFSILVACGSSNPSSSGSGSTGGSGGSGGGSGGSGGGGGTGSGGGSGSGGGTSSTSSNVAYAYVGANGTITGYAVQSNGTLTAVPGSPYAGPAESPVTNGSYLFADDLSEPNGTISGGQKIGVYTLNKQNGALALQSSSTGVSTSNSVLMSLSLDHTGQFLYASENGNNGVSDIETFDVSNGIQGAALAETTGSPYFGARISFSPDNRYAYGVGCWHGAFAIYSLSRASNGTLTALANTGTVPQQNDNDQYCGYSVAVSAQNYLALSYTSGVPGSPISLALYTINSDGSLTLAQNTAVATASMQHAVIGFDPSGKYLACAGDGGVQVFQLSAASLTVLPGSPQTVGVSFEDVQWDHNGHVFASSDSNLYVYTFANGTLTAQGAPYAGGGMLTVPRLAPLD
ncbi:MAG TPA: beta-propeller fold lactonase family protein [Candidatus Sulfotelmatobacter sp.]|nr:beta-propeller fold lactonase family protein [Candidatus Sulfotelmatobacter sp.]